MKHDVNGWERVRRVFRLPVSRQQIDRELRDEFRFHIDGRVEQLMESGMSRASAEREVQTRFGDYDKYWQSTRKIDEDTMRATHRFEFVSMLWSELRHSARVLLRTPAFSLIALTTLALGIGATTAIYTVLDAVVLRPLPYRNAEQLVSVLHPATVP
ncbi:MAG: permease prefix domain 1-containing protein, partial [Gemmatimonadaceae bacterium]